MADYKKYKVGITVKEPWANNISYEQLDMTLFAVENGGDGCAYVALKPNIGVRPNQDPTTWIKATQRGQSIYDYCIEYGLFEGTEEEFAQDYADAVQAAKDAAASATHVEEEVSAAEQGRVSAENARVSAESQRASAEESRVSSEAQRSVNETGRVNAEDSRVAAENARVVAESQRVSAESTRATNEENRRAEFGGMMRDAETAIGLVDTAMTEAENVDATVDGMIVTITDRHGVSKSVNIGFDVYRTYGSVAAMNADAANVEDGKFVMIATLDPTSTENAQLWVRNSNAATSQNPFTFLSDLDQASSAAWADWMENQKPIIEADHTTAVADHTQAVSDHTNAANDHAVAGQDHTTAGTDHTQAVSDSTRAGQDHLAAEQDHTRAEGDHTTASTDHSTAQSDHTTAGTDHTTASSDHTIASGDHTTALSDHDIASGDHTTAGTDHTRAESDHTTASDDHTRAESDHTLAASDHTTASSDHGIALTDHTTAQGDHTQAGDDHTIASADHANATSDHTLAGNDHTRAESDHSTAAEDHTNAVADHTQAGEDHAQYLLDHDSIASKANVAPNPTNGNVAALDSGGNPVDSGIPSEKVAKTDGFYEGMGVGVAKAIAGNQRLDKEFTSMVVEGADGVAKINEVRGKSLVWNQLIEDGKLVDMGLPSGTLWATCNIDVTQADGFAASPYQYDCSFFSWGNIDGHNPISNSAFDYNWGGANAQEPYYENQPYGSTQGNTLTGNITAGRAFDAARANLGVSWRMPTSAEFKELCDNCDYINADGEVIAAATTDKRVTVNGVLGIYLKSKNNGNRIFFACSGFGGGTSWNYRGSHGYYWSSSFRSALNALGLNFLSSGVSPQYNYGNRYGGFAVRPVISAGITTDDDGHKLIQYKNNVSDATLMFGAGNEPATVAEFENLFPDAYYEYNDGEIINNATEKLDVTGFNQWDEEWESGTINDTGEPVARTDIIRSKNFIPVLPSQTYYIKLPVGSAPLFFYDESLNYITPFYGDYSNSEFIIPNSARYMKFRLGANYGTTYNHDICINISDPSRNGTYEPYKHGVVPLNLSTITGKLVGVEDAESVVIFPDGMRQAGSVADTLLVDDDGYARRAVVKTGSVDLGTLEWTYQYTGYAYPRFMSDVVQSIKKDVGANLLSARYVKGNAPIMDTNVDLEISSYSTGSLYVHDFAYTSAAELKTSLNGVILYYELAEYKEYTLDEPILMTFKAYHGGTIVQSPQAPDSAPMSMNVTFALDAVGTLNNLPKNYISADSMDAFLAQLGTAMNGTWTKSWDVLNNRYGFTFTPNTQGE